MTVPTPNSMPGAQAAAPAPTVTPPAPTVTPPAPAAPAAPAAPTPPAPSADPTPTPATPPAADNPTPPWGDDANFDPQRAWNLIQNLRTENASRTEAAEASTTEADRLRKQVDNANGRISSWRTAAVLSKVEALAAGRFVDTETVLLHLGDLSQYATAEAIDETKLTTRLAELAQNKPFLLAPTGPAGFTPNPAQGQSGNGGPLTAAQVAAQAESQGDMKASGLAKASQLIDLRAASGVK